jgi:hypothetical protein
MEIDKEDSETLQGCFGSLHGRNLWENNGESGK